MDPAMAKEVAVLARNRALNEAIEKGDSDIQKFYRGATLFITGGSGFMGKQCIEKILRACDVKKIYILLRAKKKKSVAERLEALITDPVFDVVRKMKPAFMEKLHLVEGDVGELKLGIGDEDWARITEEVEIIIHGAATVNFDEAIKMATLTNVRGTIEALNLGKACKNLRSFVHISTEFSFATWSRMNKNLYEKFYEPPVKPQVMVNMVQCMEEQRLIDITQGLIKDWPNTYTFTKAIAEDAVREMSSELPISIIRPSIVIASKSEPSPGWLDVSCAYGPSGMILGGGLGVMHVVKLNDNININLVPVDIVNNAIIAAAYETHNRQKTRDTEPKIYAVTSCRNQIQLQRVVDVMMTKGRQNYSTPSAVWFVFTITTSSQILYNFLSMIWHYIPAYIVDFFLKLARKRPMLVQIYKKADKLYTVLSYFTCHEWVHSDNNLQKLYFGLSQRDQQIFNFDITTMDWEEMIINWIIGVRKYIVKDGLQGTEYSKKKQFRLKILHYIVSSLYFFTIYKIVYLAFSFIYIGIRFFVALFGC